MFRSHSTIHTPIRMHMQTADLAQSATQKKMSTKHCVLRNREYVIQPFIQCCCVQ